MPGRTPKARFKRRISVVSNAIETIDNEMICFIIYCLNCIRHGRNATYERGLNLSKSCFFGEEDQSGCKSQNIVIRALKGKVLCQIWFEWTY